MWNKKSEIAVAMLGGLENIRQLIPVFKNYDIKIVEKEFILSTELLEGIEKEKASIVLISDVALVGLEDGKRQIIKDIRHRYKDVFIALFLSHEEPDEQFTNWAFGYGVYNLYYADKDGNYNFTQILPELQERRMPQRTIVQSQEPIIVEKVIEVEKTIPQIVEKEVPVEVVREVIKEVPVEIEKEVIREVPIEIEKEVIREVEREVIREVPVERIVEKKVYVPGKMLGFVSIGVINLAHGAGATTAAVSLAESFAQDGYATAVIAMDDKKDLHYLDKKRLKANYVIPSTNEEKGVYLTALQMEGHHFIVHDYGNLFPILADGTIKVELMKEKESEIKEFMRCTYKVAVGFSNDWNMRKLEFFANNDRFDLNSFFFYIQEGGKELRKYNLNLCSDYAAIADMIRQQAGLEQERKDKRPAFPFLFG